MSHYYQHTSRIHVPLVNSNTFTQDFLSVRLPARNDLTTMTATQTHMNTEQGDGNSSYPSVLTYRAVIRCALSSNLLSGGILFAYPTAKSESDYPRLRLRVTKRKYQLLLDDVRFWKLVTAMGNPVSMQYNIFHNSCHHSAAAMRYNKNPPDTNACSPS
jgi:hypothetical protein